MVLNAPAGACTKLLGLRGPTTTLTTGDGSGLVALVYAALFLGARADADHLLAGGLDERDADQLAAGLVDEAACLVLSSAPGKGPPVRLAGFGLAGPGALADAVAQARRQAGLSGDEPREAAPALSTAAASGSLGACAAALEALRRGEARSLIVTDPGGSAASAVILTTNR